MTSLGLRFALSAGGGVLSPSPGEAGMGQRWAPPSLLLPLEIAPRGCFVSSALQFGPIEHNHSLPWEVLTFVHAGPVANVKRRWKNI